MAVRLCVASRFVAKRVFGDRTLKLLRRLGLRAATLASFCRDGIVSRHAFSATECVSRDGATDCDWRATERAGDAKRRAVDRHFTWPRSVWVLGVRSMEWPHGIHGRSVWRCLRTHVHAGGWGGHFQQACFLVLRRRKESWAKKSTRSPQDRPFCRKSSTQRTDEDEPSASRSIA